MLSGPFTDEFARRRRTDGTNQLPARKVKSRILPLIFSVEVTGFVVVEVHSNDDSEERGDDRHEFDASKRSCVAQRMARSRSAFGVSDFGQSFFDCVRQVERQEPRGWVEGIFAFFIDNANVIALLCSRIFEEFVNLSRFERFFGALILDANGKTLRLGFRGRSQSSPPAGGYLLAALLAMRLASDNCSRDN